MEYIAGRLLVSDEIYNRLLEKILTGCWAVGERLPSEKQLCEMFGASRVSVRAALQKLQANELIVTRQGVGSIIQAPADQPKNDPFAKSNISESTFKQFLEFRTMLEFKAVDLIIDQYDQEVIAKIKKAMLEFEENAPKGQKELNQYDYQFHMTVIQGCGNEFIIQAMNMFKESFFRYVEEVHRMVPLPLDYLLRSHRAMVDALVQRRSDVWRKIILEDAVFYQKPGFQDGREAVEK